MAQRNGRHTPPKPSNVAPLLPHSVEAEESLLGAMLLSPRAISAAADASIGPEHYYWPARGHIHAAIVAVHGRGNGVDALTVADELERSEHTPPPGGWQAVLVELQAGTLGAGAAANHAAIIARTAEQRHALAVLAEATEAARNGEPVADILARIASPARPAGSQPLPVTPVHELLANPPERRTVIIDGLLRAGELAVVIAESNVGKSWWCMQLALTLAEGHGTFLGFRARRACHVLYVHREMDAEGAYDRWTTLLGNDTMPPRITDAYDPVHLAIIEEQVVEGNRRIRRHLPEGHEALEARIAADRPDVVFIDTWGAVFDGDENSKAETGAIVAVLGRIADTYGCAIVVVHHYRKLGNAERRGDPFADARGSSRLIDAAHTRIAITGHYTPSTARAAGLDEEEARRYADVTFRRRVGRKPPTIAMRFDSDSCRWLLWDDPDAGPAGDQATKLRARLARSEARTNEDLALVIDAAERNGGGFESVNDAAALLGVGYASALRMVRAAVLQGVLAEHEGPRRAKVFTLTNRGESA